MALWYKPGLTAADLQPLGKNTMGDHLGMQFVEVGPDYIKATMPVDHRTHQPMGLLHGGASVALAETVGSVASACVVNQDKFNCVGLEINANHIRGVRSGEVTATCKPLHIGGSTHVWDIQIHDEHNRLVCISRLTVAVLKKPDSK
ncbi:hotdog fold thioesterase [Deminuibacter soli]|uniref:Hotdog fold thioesterase n=1 Tax=Deminuibacter soli TaxID=2291815 RepID=A0A3E1NJM3_9BACT|nr:hotdog fold thioesterase [Deminuibacter soli]RFM28133.1 hotdog fold thioesterase [Deminuibacter soli]